MIVEQKIPFCLETVKKILEEHEAAAKTRAEVEYVHSCLPADDVVIAGLHVTSWRPCWLSRTKAFLSSGK